MSTWTPEMIETMPWFRELQKLVQAEIDKASAGVVDRRPAVEAEIADLKNQIRGWRLSLGKPDLDEAVRDLLSEKDVASSVTRLTDREAELTSMDSVEAPAQVDPKALADRLNRLADVLSGNNPSRINLELSCHIDKILCFPDGRVVVRTCKLGALAGDSRILVTNSPPAIESGSASLMKPGRPRKRGIRQLNTEDAGTSLRNTAHWAADVNRFAHLGADWFWEDELRIPDPTCWAKENASNVATLRLQGLTIAQIGAAL